MMLNGFGALASWKKEYMLLVKVKYARVGIFAPPVSITVAINVLNVSVTTKKK